jgi:hypothetical protein
MVIGVLELGLELLLVLVLVLVLLLELLLQAARTLTDSTAVPVRAKARLGSQGRLGLTPGSSFLLVPSSVYVCITQWCRARRAHPRAR